MRVTKFKRPLNLLQPSHALIECFFPKVQDQVNNWTSTRKNLMKTFYIKFDLVGPTFTSFYLSFFQSDVVVFFSVNEFTLSVSVIVLLRFKFTGNQFSVFHNFFCSKFLIILFCPVTLIQIEICYL